MRLSGVRTRCIYRSVNKVVAFFATTTEIERVRERISRVGIPLSSAGRCLRIERVSGGILRA